MKKNEFVKNVAETINTGLNLDTKITLAQADTIITSVFDVIKTAIVSGEDVRVADFGTFTRVDRAERAARNPQTGEPMVIAASKAPKFKASKALKDAVNA